MTESSKSGAVTISLASVTDLPICNEGIEIARAVLPTRRRLTLSINGIAHAIQAI